VSSIGQSIKEGHQPLLTRKKERRPLSPGRRLAPVVGVLLAVALGAVLALVASLPTSWLALACLSVCGAFGAVVWHWTGLPLVPALRFALVFSFSFRLEINFLTVEKYHEAPPGLNLSLTMILALLLLVIRHAETRAAGRHERVFPRGFVVAFWALFAWCAISVVYAPEVTLGVYALVGLLTSAMVGYAAAACYDDPQALREVVLAVAVSIACSGLIGVLQYSLGFATDWKILGAVAEDGVQRISDGEVSRVGGLLTMANAFAWFLVTFLPVIIAPLLLRCRSFRGWERLLLFGATGLGTVALILTFARGSWISFVLAMVLLAGLSYRATLQSDRARYLWRVTGVTALMIFLVLPFAPMIYTRLTEDDRGAAETRIPLMQIAFNMIKDNPLLGVGLSGYESEHRRYDDTKEKVLDDFDWPVHNIFLHFTAEAGIPSLIFFLLMTGIVIRQAWPVLQSPDQLGRALAAGLLAGLFAFMFTGLKELGSLGSALYRIYFFYLGLLVATRRIAECGMGNGEPREAK